MSFWYPVYLLKQRTFHWTETINVTYNANKVLSLSSGSTNYPLGYSRAGEDEGVGVAYMSQALGKSAYQIFVADPARDANGKIIIDPTTGAPAAGTNYVDVVRALTHGQQVLPVN